MRESNQIEMVLLRQENQCDHDRVARINESAFGATIRNEFGQQAS